MEGCRVVACARLDCKGLRSGIKQTCPAEPHPPVVYDMTMTAPAVAVVAVQGCWCSAIERGAAGGPVASADARLQKYQPSNTRFALVEMRSHGDAPLYDPELVCLLFDGGGRRLISGG